MAVYPISAYRIAWTVQDRGRGHFAFQANGEWSKPIALPTSADVAAIAAILRGGPKVVWDSDHGALICGSGIQTFADSEKRILAMPQVEGGDGPFPPK